MTRREAKEKAAARGFTSVNHWMQENRKAAASFRSSPAKGAARRRLNRLARALDDEFNQFNILR